MKRAYYRWRLRVWKRRVELRRKIWIRTEMREAMWLPNFPGLGPTFWEREFTRAIGKVSELKRRLAP